jgi:Holin of 3TMs, for gene-transfer release
MPIISGILAVLRLIFPSIIDLGGKVLQNQAVAGKSAHDENVAAQDAFAREFSYGAANRNWFDSLMDGLNRLPRPMMALSCISLFYAAFWKPSHFAIAMLSLSGVPDPLWKLLYMIVAFYFVSRAITTAGIGRVTEADAAKSRRVARDVEESRQEAAEDEDLARAKIARRKAEASPGAPVGLMAGLMPTERRESVMDLAGFGPGQLTRTGFTGTLPRSRAAGWRNPVAAKYTTK